MHPFKKGFVLKCAEYGLDKSAAKELFKKLAGAPKLPPSNEAGQTGIGGGKVTAPAPVNLLANAPSLSAKTIPGRQALDSMEQLSNPYGGGPAANINANRNAVGSALNK